jgi:hypothetical protein
MQAKVSILGIRWRLSEIDFKRNNLTSHAAISIINS